MQPNTKNNQDLYLTTDMDFKCQLYEHSCSPDYALRARLADGRVQCDCIFSNCSFYTVAFMLINTQLDSLKTEERDTLGERDREKEEENMEESRVSKR